MPTLTWRHARGQATFRQGADRRRDGVGRPEAPRRLQRAGPCDDIRIKPDVVAPGTDIAADAFKAAPLSKFWGAYPQNRHYAFMGGTSMACPIVAGCARWFASIIRETRGTRSRARRC